MDGYKNIPGCTKNLDPLLSQAFAGDKACLCKAIQSFYRKIGRLPDVTAAKYITKRNPTLYSLLLRDTSAFSNLQHFSFNGAHNVAHIVVPKECFANHNVYIYYRPFHFGRRQAKRVRIVG